MNRIIPIDFKLIPKNGRNCANFLWLDARSLNSAIHRIVFFPTATERNKKQWAYMQLMESNFNLKTMLFNSVAEYVQKV